MIRKRPQTLKEYIGQDRIRPLIAAELQAARKRHRPFRHTLLFGSPGLGKTSLAAVIANEMGAVLMPHTAKAEWKSDRVRAMLLGLPIEGYGKGGQRMGGAQYVIFMDECHKLPDFESWYKPLEDREIDDRGGVSWLPEFTFIGATTDLWKVPKPFRDRCSFQIHLEPYTVDNLVQIIRFNYPHISPDMATEAAKRSRNTARIAIDYAESVMLYGIEYFDMIGVDERGLTPLDRAVLKALQESDRPLSLNSLASMVGEATPQVIAEIVEPYLLSLGLIQRTNRGRVPAEIGRGGLNPPESPEMALDAKSDSLSSFLVSVHSES